MPFSGAFNELTSFKKASTIGTYSDVQISTSKKVLLSCLLNKFIGKVGFDFHLSDPSDKDNPSHT